MSLCCLLFVGSQSAAARLRGAAYADSLLHVLLAMPDDSNKVRVLVDLAFYYSTAQPDSGLLYGRQGLELASRFNIVRARVPFYDVIGLCYDLKAEYKTAIGWHNRAFRLSDSLHDPRLAANVANNLATSHYNMADYENAAKWYKYAMDVAAAEGDSSTVTRAWGNLGMVYSTQSNYPKALECYLRSLKGNERLGDMDGVATCHMNIGGVYVSQARYQKALDEFMAALPDLEKNGDRQDLSYLYNNIAQAYYFLHNINLALDYNARAYKLSEELGDRSGMAVVAADVGSILTDQHDYLQGIAWIKKALDLARRTGDKNAECNALLSLAQAYVKLVDSGGQARPPYSEAVAVKLLPVSDIPPTRAARLQLALALLNKAQLIAEANSYGRELKEIHGCRAEAGRLSGNYKLAFESNRLYTRLKDSIFSRENEMAMLQQQLRYDFGKREDSLKLVSARQEKESALRLQRQRGFTLAGIGGILALAAVSLVVLRNNKLLGREKKRSDDLLLNILPATVAAELKENGQARARQYDNVTVLFSDFVNFTSAAESISPQALVDELHTCFQAFDAIAAKYGIEKIKTIGDAYLAVAGLPTPDPLHALHVVNAAREINDFMQARLAMLGDRTFKIRIGIHSGSVVAGIVGAKKFAYDIWGDTVNTAARMEQHSLPGRINLSEVTYLLVKETVHCEYRGELEVKGKGAMKMYFLG